MKFVISYPGLGVSKALKYCIPFHGLKLTPFSYHPSPFETATFQAVGNIMFQVFLIKQNNVKSSSVKLLFKGRIMM